MGRINLILISLGFAGGFGTGFYLGKRKYEGLADLEVESMRRYFEENFTKNEIEIVKKVVVETKKTGSPLEDNPLIIKDEVKKYKDYSKPYQTEKSDTRIPGQPIVEKELTEEERRNSDGPYIITPGEFGESTYEAQTLFFYADRVLADDDYNVVHDISGTIGDEALGSFGMHEVDCVHVRNDTLAIDYEILIDERYFAKVTNKPVAGVKETE